MARTVAGIPGGARVTDFISLGVISRRIPAEEVRRVLAETGRESQRQRKLPMHVMMYYVIALALYMEVSYGGAGLAGATGEVDPDGAEVFHFAWRKSTLVMRTGEATGALSRSFAQGLSSMPGDSSMVTESGSVSKSSISTLERGRLRPRCNDEASLSFGSP
jgi:hypothetical protein